MVVNLMAMTEGKQRGPTRSGEAQRDREGPGGRHRKAGQRRKRGTRGKKRDEKSSGSLWHKLPVQILAALVLALLIKTFVLQQFWIPSGSMESTLLVNDRVLVNKVIYSFQSIERGDIVVFSGEGSWDGGESAPDPANPVSRFFRSLGSSLGLVPGEKDYIKRVIGLPGDHVECCDARGRVTVNGVPLNGDTYIYPGDAPSERPFEVTVPSGRLWVMGDHRSASADSRSHREAAGGGTIPIDEVAGRAFAVVWPLSRIGLLDPPATFERPELQNSQAAPRVADVPGVSVQRAGVMRTPAATLGLTGAAPIVVPGWRRRVARGHVIRDVPATQ